MTPQQLGEPSMKVQQIREILDNKWNTRSRTIDWLSFEQFQRDIIESHELSERQKLVFLAEALGAWTRRGTPELG